MKLGVMIGYWMGAPTDPTELVVDAERLVERARAFSVERSTALYVDLLTSG